MPSLLIAPLILNINKINLNKGSFFTSMLYLFILTICGI